MTRYREIMRLSAMGPHRGGSSAPPKARETQGGAPMSTGANESKDCGIADVDELLRGVTLSMPAWERKLQHAFPFCGTAIEYQPQTDPAILMFRCEYGHNGFVKWPYGERDKRYDSNFEEGGFEIIFTNED